MVSLATPAKHEQASGPDVAPNSAGRSEAGDEDRLGVEESRPGVCEYTRVARDTGVTHCTADTLVQMVA